GGWRRRRVHGLRPRALPAAARRLRALRDRARRAGQPRPRRRRPRQCPHGAVARDARAARRHPGAGVMETLVLVPALNEAARSGRVLAGIRAAVPDADIVVVDDGSTDDTGAVARAAGARVARP